MVTIRKGTKKEYLVIRLQTRQGRPSEDLVDVCDTEQEGLLKACELMAEEKAKNVWFEVRDG